MVEAGSEPPLVTLGVALLWIPGLFCLAVSALLLVFRTHLPG